MQSIMGEDNLYENITCLNSMLCLNCKTYRNHHYGNDGYYFLRHPERKHYRKELLMLDMADM